MKGNVYTMEKIIWRANRVISIETKRKDESRDENVYVLAQMINKAQLLVFNLFNTDNNWENINLDESHVLFCTSVTRQFIKNSNIWTQKVQPLTSYMASDIVIDIGMGRRRITLWEGTPYEKSLLLSGRGGGRLVSRLGGEDKSKIPWIDPADNETIDKYELSNVRIYAEFNERLYLCYKLGRNVDPMKDLVFDRPIPLEYKEYVDIISS